MATYLDGTLMPNAISASGIWLPSEPFTSVQIWDEFEHVIEEELTFLRDRSQSGIPISIMKSIDRNLEIVDDVTSQGQIIMKNRMRGSGIPAQVQVKAKDIFPQNLQMYAHISTANSKTGIPDFYIYDVRSAYSDGKSKYRETSDGTRERYIIMGPKRYVHTECMVSMHVHDHEISNFVDDKSFFQALVAPANSKDSYSLQLIRQKVNYMIMHDIHVGFIATDSYVRFMCRPYNMLPDPSGTRGGLIWFSKPYPRTLDSADEEYQSSLLGYILSILCATMRGSELWPGYTTSEMQMIFRNDYWGARASFTSKLFKSKSPAEGTNIDKNTSEAIPKVRETFPRISRLARQQRILSENGETPDYEKVKSYEYYDYNGYNECINQNSQNDLGEYDGYENDKQKIQFQSSQSNEHRELQIQNGINENDESCKLESLHHKTESPEHLEKNDNFEILDLAKDNQPKKHQNLENEQTHTELERNYQNSMSDADVQSTGSSVSTLQTYSSLPSAGPWNSLNPLAVKVGETLVNDMPTTRAQSLYEAHYPPLSSASTHSSKKALPRLYKVHETEVLSKVEKPPPPKPRIVLWHELMSQSQPLSSRPSIKGQFDFKPQILTKRFPRKFFNPRAAVKNCVISLTKVPITDWYEMCRPQTYTRNQGYETASLQVTFNAAEQIRIIETFQVVVKRCEYSHSFFGENRKSSLEQEARMYRYLESAGCRAGAVPKMFGYGDVWNSNKMLILRPWGRPLRPLDMCQEIVSKMKVCLQKLHEVNVLLYIFELDIFGIGPDDSIRIVDLRYACRVKKITHKNREEEFLLLDHLFAKYTLSVSQRVPCPLFEKMSMIQKIRRKSKDILGRGNS